MRSGGRSSHFNEFEVFGLSEGSSGEAWFSPARGASISDGFEVDQNLSTSGSGSALCKRGVFSGRKTSSGVLHARARLSHTQDQLSLTLTGSV